MAMALTYESDFIFIGKGDESFLENYSYELSADPAALQGKIFMALEILNNMTEAEDIGEAVFANFKQKFFDSGATDPYERFEEALKAANQTIETLKEEKVSRFIGNLNVTIGAVMNGNLYISTAGDAEVYLVRKRFVSVVSEGLAEDAKGETFANIANGSLEPRDTVIFSSSRLLRYITKSELGRVVGEVSGHGKISLALSDLQDFIMAEILGRSALIGVYMEERAEDGEEISMEEERKGVIGGGVRGIFGKIAEWMPGISLGGKIKFLSVLKEKILRGMPAAVSAGKSGAGAAGSAIRRAASKLPKINFHERMPKKHILLAAIALGVLLVTGIFWLKTRGETKRAIAEQQTKLNHAIELINDASTVGQFDKPKASELLASAEKETLEVLNSRYLRSDAVKTLDEVRSVRDSLDDIKRITNPTVLADFSEKRANVSALGFMALKDRLYGFEYNALYEVVLDKLQDPLTINDIETVILGTPFTETNSLLFLTRTGKMIEHIAGQFVFIPTKDGIWKKGVDMKTYNERLYILDPERNQIWRYTHRRDSFDAGEAYNQNADLSKAVSIAIDAAVYVLNSDGTITQLYQGQKQDYPLRRAPLNAITAPAKLFTGSDLNHLFVLEPATSRVILFRKDPKNGGAQYQSQYVFEKTGTLRDLTVADNRLYVMDDKKVYFVNLSGLE